MLLGKPSYCENHTKHKSTVVRIQSFSLSEQVIYIEPLDFERWKNIKSEIAVIHRLLQCFILAVIETVAA
jgi:hypothetical protein